jgi:hypothetical protein
LAGTLLLEFRSGHFVLTTKEIAMINKVVLEGIIVETNDNTGINARKS